MSKHATGDRARIGVGTQAFLRVRPAEIFSAVSLVKFLLFVRIQRSATPLGTQTWKSMFRPGVRGIRNACARPL